MRSVLITGCSSGIGADAAAALRARGWRVFATARAPADVARLTAEGFEALQVDAADAGSCEAAMADIHSRVPALDAYIANAAFPCPGLVEDLPRAAYREVFETNVFGAIDLARLAIPAMRRAGHGRLVFVSSVLGFVAARARGAYVSSKFALEGLADTLRLELMRTDLHTILIQPGPIRTRIRQNARPPFERHVAWQDSPRRAFYDQTLLPRLYDDDPPPDRFELPPAAVSAVLIRALEARRPRARYKVTTPTHLAAALRWALPTRALDRILHRS